MPVHDCPEMEAPLRGASNGCESPSLDKNAWGRGAYGLKCSSHSGCPSRNPKAELYLLAGNKGASADPGNTIVPSVTKR